MTTFEIAVPLMALGLAALSLVYVRWLSHRLERQQSERTPAE